MDSGFWFGIVLSGSFVVVPAAARPLCACQHTVPVLQAYFSRPASIPAHLTSCCADRYVLQSVWTCAQGMDIMFLHHTIAATLDQKGHSVQLLFAFEYIILASTAAATLLKYLLSMLDSAMEGRWEGKGTYVFYLELLKDMMHLFVYCIFFVIVFSNYGLPLHLVSDGSGCIGFRVQPGLFLGACGVGRGGWGDVGRNGHVGRLKGWKWNTDGLSAG